MRFKMFKKCFFCMFILNLTLSIIVINGFNIEDFGAKSNDSSFETAILNGQNTVINHLCLIKIKN